MNLQEVVQNIVEDTAIELTQEFDRNFERKGFFDKKWPTNKLPNNRGSQMMRSGDLRRSINPRVGNGAIRWESSLPYTVIQNEGGEIEVTAKMKSFFWAMYYKANGGAESGGERGKRLSAEAAKWKALALQKVGEKMIIEQHQYIGWHPKVDSSIADITADNMKEYGDKLYKQLT